MTSSGKSLIDKWNVLLAGRHHETAIELPTYSTDIRTLDGDVLIGLNERGRRKLLLPISPRNILIPDSTPALCIEHLTLEKESVKHFLSVTNIREELDSVFVEVADEVLYRIEAGFPCINALKDVLEEFRCLLFEGKDEVSTNQIRGLAGELYLLNSLLRHNPNAWRFWQGSEGARHDFNSGTHSIEVKTGGRPSQKSVSIFSIDQLEELPGGQLTLAHIILEETNSGTISIASLFKESVGLAGGSLSLRNLLAATGCTDPQSPVWNRVSFSHISTHFYSVLNGFPRVVESSFSGRTIPSGVSAIKYSIDLSFAADFLIPKEQEEWLLEEFANDSSS